MSDYVALVLSVVEGLIRPTFQGSAMRWRDYDYKDTGSPLKTARMTGGGCQTDASAFFVLKGR